MYLSALCSQLSAVFLALHISVIDYFPQRVLLLHKEEVMFGLGMPELIIILVIVLIIFGAGRISEIGGAIGKGIKSFKKSANEPDSIDVTPKDEKDKEQPKKQ
jgi:sec-independent protein translocase protein TatA